MNTKEIPVKKEKVLSLPNFFVIGLVILFLLSYGMQKEWKFQNCHFFWDGESCIQNKYREFY